MKWFIAKLVFNIDIGSGSNAHQFEEQVRLIEAASFAEAFIKAKAIGEAEEYCFENINNKNVCWKFIDLIHIQEVNDFQHGSLFISSTREEENPEEFINFVKRKASLLHVREIEFN